MGCNGSSSLKSAYGQRENAYMVKTNEKDLDELLKVNENSRAIEEKFNIKTEMKVSDAYEIDQMLGSGSYASVRRVYRSDHSKIPFALKSFNKSQKFRYSELEILNLIDHPCIPKVIETYKDTGNVHLVMQYCGGMSLSDLFYQILDGELTLTTDEILSIFYQICKTISFMKQKQI